MAYQSFIVHVIVIFNVTIALIAVNVSPLGINNPWVTLVLIPVAVAGGTYAANQLKTIGAQTPNSSKTVTETTVTPPPNP